ncbi:putative alcohol dehydrogenase [Colletotrichum truncatum]|uniref:Alcohol dehydrogenase n=1 Tax=Colletotrichum truncatum TaxID=5467 RepID=A0ACC3ZFR4_COLTU|nr:putative alcohol dehydrogenase [Colletotrichum truncatum]KAF6801657.1 putative alcohol dehydrogenase [Colletotrichum truncatum]
MATVPPSQLGFAQDTKVLFSSSGLKTEANVEHVEHIHPIEHGSSANETTNTEEHTELTNIETMAYVVEEVNAEFKLVPVILDGIRPDEVLIEMKYSGICHTDVVTQRGGLPFVEFPAILGHEGAGIVRAIGKDVKIKDLAVGDHVLLSFNSCGSCNTCTSGHPALCPDSSKINVGSVRMSDKSTPARLATDGRPVRSQFFGHSSFSKMSVVSAKSVVRCPKTAADHMELYAPLGCGLQTGAGTVLNIIKPGKQDSIVIFGLGSVGIAALLAARYLEVGQIIAVDIVPERLKLGKDLGASHVINSVETASVVEEIQKLTSGGPKFAVDCTGILGVIEDMIRCVRPLGTAVLVGVPPPAAEIKIDPQAFLLGNKRLIGVIEGDSYPPQFIPQLIAMHQEGKFPIERLCRTYPASQLNKAIQDMQSGQVMLSVSQVIKPVIKWD